MIIANGTIEFANDVAGEVYTYFPAIACQYYPRKLDFLALSKQSEPYTQESYVVLIDDVRRTLPSNIVRLRDRRGQEVGVFSITSTEDLEAVNQIKITL